ncbi:hypothetical protein Sp245p_01680 [Azospirillum baldaniorum]|uniref:Uncharacterized protein n=2 Tax=Azospirillum TaxID=191 RepID=A0A9P1JMY1_9PROT|nr:MULTISPECIES: hypothetical protein [Azospirillum]TWA79893.1 hypothetical protein FBZ85_104233 [Azospirillum brasilense]AWJ88579.1 hypothetical protein Sp245p_01680 [Azospirillum baldaniorum]MBK3801786.1 hypothetical protein [Azospirillum argentinense]NUB06200.1 hypothetical protein [Azospirillum baldaniorum]TWA68464.1 hypothetical protein FBZ84_104109 [Azospirillum baldaniorum]
MDESFIAKPLGQRQIDQAYPLVRAIFPDLPVEQWRAFAAALIGPVDTPATPTGIMTVQNARGYLHGLFSYAIAEHLRHGRILAVENFVVLDLFDMTGPAETLLHSMDRLARSHGCTAIHTSLPELLAGETGSRGSLLTCFHQDGHRTETLRLCKAMDGANDNRAHRSQAESPLGIP